MSVLALDLSKTSTGWALWRDGWEAPRFGRWKLGGEYSTPGDVFLKLQERMHELRMIDRYERVVIEEPINPGQLQGHTTINTIRLAIGLASHAESYAKAMRCQYREINVGTWRADFIGRGEVSGIRKAIRDKAKQTGKKVSATDSLKDATMLRCRQFGWKPRNNDEGDALGLIDYDLCLSGVQTPWRMAEILQPMAGVK